MITKYEFFKQNLKHLIQYSELDIGIVYFILKDTFRDIENLYYSMINDEKLHQKENDDNLNGIDKTGIIDKAEE